MAREKAREKGSLSFVEKPLTAKRNVWALTSTGSTRNPPRPPLDLEDALSDDGYDDGGDDGGDDGARRRRSLFTAGGGDDGVGDVGGDDGGARGGDGGGDGSMVSDWPYLRLSWVTVWSDSLRGMGIETDFDSVPALDTDFFSRELLLRRYLVAFYWALMTLTTVGYGDVGMKSQNELIWSIVVMVVGACSFGYIIGSVTALITREDEAETLIRDKVCCVASLKLEMEQTGIEWR